VERLRLWYTRVIDSAVHRHWVCHCRLDRQSQNRFIQASTFMTGCLFRSSVELRMTIGSSSPVVSPFMPGFDHASIMSTPSPQPPTLPHWCGPQLET
jgi:hypothetical protein